MENYQLLMQLQQEIQNNFLDIKAETLMAIAIENGITGDDFMIASDSLFNRAYSRDVLSAALAEDANKKSFLQLHLSRTGLYDQLPEGVFHQRSKSKPIITTAANMAADYKINQQKDEKSEFSSAKVLGFPIVA